jgi:ribosomal-protein-alanine N-acetyltransferase
MQLTALNPALAEATLGALYAETPGPSLHFLVGLLARAACRAWSLTDQESPLGVIWYQCVEDEAELLDLRIRPALRRSGYGRMLLEESLRLIGQGGSRAVTLEVRESNTAAKSLYAAAGFTIMGRRRNYYPMPTGDREDAILMSLALQEREWA